VITEHTIGWVEMKLFVSGAEGGHHTVVVAFAPTVADTGLMLLIRDRWHQQTEAETAALEPQDIIIG
jgi:hypothetical protein